MSGVSLTETDAAACDQGAASFLQTGFWGSFKAEYGWRPRQFRMETEGSTLLVLERRLAKGASFAYVPRGPSVAGFPGGRTEYLANLARELRAKLSRDCVFVRFDPPWYDEEAVPGSVVRPTLRPPFIRAAADVQPPDTTILALTGRTDEELVGGMKPKWRYNIRLAEKKGVEVSEEFGSEAVGVFYSLYTATAARDRIALHPQRYYDRLLSLSREYGAEAPDIRLWIARSEGRPLAAIITSFYKDEAVYLYGASSDERRNLMPAYALQWAAIRAARDRGCAYYDFYGMPPKEDPDHPMAGLYRFKTGFGGSTAHFAGSWDYPYKSALYKGYRTAEALRSFWYKTVKKKWARGSAS